MKIRFRPHLPFSRSKPCTDHIPLWMNTVSLCQIWQQIKHHALLYLSQQEKHVFQNRDILQNLLWMSSKACGVLIVQTLIYGVMKTCDWARMMQSSVKCVIILAVCPQLSKALPSVEARRQQVPSGPGCAVMTTCHTLKTLIASSH